MAGSTATGSGGVAGSASASSTSCSAGIPPCSAWLLFEMRTRPGSRRNPATANSPIEATTEPEPWSTETAMIISPIPTTKASSKYCRGTSARNWIFRLVSDDCWRTCSSRSTKWSSCPPSWMCLIAPKACAASFSTSALCCWKRSPTRRLRAETSLAMTAVASAK